MKHNPLQSLIRAARKAHDANAAPSAESAPMGFASRVTALAREQRPAPGALDLLERLGWRCAAACVAISIITVALHSRQPAPNPFEPLLSAESETLL